MSTTEIRGGAANGTASADDVDLKLPV